MIFVGFDRLFSAHTAKMCMKDLKDETIPEAPGNCEGRSTGRSTGVGGATAS